MRGRTSLKKRVQMVSVKKTKIEIENWRFFYLPLLFLTNYFLLLPVLRNKNQHLVLKVFVLKHPDWLDKHITDYFILQHFIELGLVVWQLAPTKVFSPF